MISVYTRANRFHWNVDMKCNCNLRIETLNIELRFAKRNRKDRRGWGIISEFTLLHGVIGILKVFSCCFPFIKCVIRWSEDRKHNKDERENEKTGKGERIVRLRIEMIVFIVKLKDKAKFYNYVNNTKLSTLPWLHYIARSPMKLCS